MLSSVFGGWTRIYPTTGSKNDLPRNVEFQNYECVSDDGWEVITEKPLNKAEEIKHLQTYSAGEFLTHEFAYRKDLKEPSVVEILETDGSKRNYYSFPLSTDHKGLVGYVLMPKDIQTNEKPDIKVVFRGTNPSSWDSVKRDLELGGAGSISFEKNRESILKQINQAIRTYSANHTTSKISLTFGGHSLGGADAQNALAATMSALLQPETAQHLEQFQKITQLQLFTYNSAGVPQFTADKAAQDAAMLSENGIKINAYNQRVAGDGVQQTGEAHLFSNVSPEHVNVDVLKIRMGHEHNTPSLVKTAGALAAATAIAGPAGLAVASAATVGMSALGLRDTALSHTKKPHKSPVEAQYERLNNKETPEAITRELTNKSDLLNTLHSAAGQLFGFEQHVSQAAPAPETKSKSLWQRFWG